MNVAGFFSTCLFAGLRHPCAALYYNNIVRDTPAMLSRDELFYLFRRNSKAKQGLRTPKIAVQS